MKSNLIFLKLEATQLIEIILVMEKIYRKKSKMYYYLKTMRKLRDRQINNNLGFILMLIL